MGLWAKGMTMAGLFTLVITAVGRSSEIRGHYMEARTCQVYTGPCFANGEVGLTGKDAVMAWTIETGQHSGVELSGLSVAVVVRSSDTLGHAGLENARALRSIVVVDQAATPTQRQMLIEFAKRQTGQTQRTIESIRAAPFAMELDLLRLEGELRVGNLVQLKARKARPDDCICSNEVAFYPPLAKLEGFVPGVTIDGEVKARQLGRRWSIPSTRSAYLGTFAVP
jgi:hypothetical protein